MYFQLRLNNFGVTIMIDARYTTTPQDRDVVNDFDSSSVPEKHWGMLGNVSIINQYGARRLDYPDGLSTGDGPYKFWTSSANNDARLLTKGRRVLFYWPGWTSGWEFGQTSQLG